MVTDSFNKTLQKVRKSDLAIKDMHARPALKHTQPKLLTFSLLLWFYSTSSLKFNLKYISYRENKVDLAIAITTGMIIIVLVIVNFPLPL